MDRAPTARPRCRPYRQPLTLMVPPPDMLALLGTLSVALFAVTVFATPWLLARLPADYFRRPPRMPRRMGAREITWLAVRNLFGVAFLALGVIMMVTPGPGLVAIAIGLSLAEFPGKRHLLQRFVGHPRVFSGLNWIRRRRNRPPFEHPRPDRQH